MLYLWGMKKICENCKYYDIRWTPNTHPLFFMSNRRLVNYCSNIKSEKFTDKISRSDSCKKFKEK